jgi:hypothetical protein
VHVVIAFLVPDIAIGAKPLIKLLVPELPEHTDILLVRNPASLEHLL